MIVELSLAASNAMLESLAGMLDGGSLKLLSEDDRVLAELKLSDPAVEDVSDGELVFASIAEEDAAPAQGLAISAKVYAADGEVIFTCDVGDENSDAVIKLNSTRIFRGSPVRLKSFRLSMPSGGGEN
jgi:hypothetical protein